MDNNNSHSNDFGAALPLPENDRPAAGVPAGDQEAAANLIRKRVQAAYTDEPDAAEETEDITELGSSLARSKHQQFIYELTSSGKPLEEIQTIWHEYYAGLTDLEKHRVWQEFYSAHSQASNYRAAVPSMAPATENEPEPAARPKMSRRAEIAAARPGALNDIRAAAAVTLKSLRQSRAKDSLQSLLFGLGVGCIVLLIFLFSFFNERFIAPFIQPSRNVSGTPIIGSTVALSNAPEVIIPKINVEVPVVYGVDTIDDNAVENALESGVVHYADTAMPGQDGNLVIVGHSSNNIFNKGKYKFAFVLLSRLENGDTFYIQKDGKRYTYQVYKKEIVAPDNVSVLGPAEKPATATLITCDPPGTSTNRLVVTGEQISPDIGSNIASSGQNTLATSTTVVPGNSQSLWSRLVHSL
jgi:sortase A